jgi:hypothetical protein
VREGIAFLHADEPGEPVDDDDEVESEIGADI